MDQVECQVEYSTPSKWTCVRIAYFGPTVVTLRPSLTFLDLTASLTDFDITQP